MLTIEQYHAANIINKPNIPEDLFPAYAETATDLVSDAVQHRDTSCVANGRIKLEAEIVAFLFNQQPPATEMTVGGAQGESGTLLDDMARVGINAKSVSETIGGYSYNVTVAPEKSHIQLSAELMRFVENQAVKRLSVCDDGRLSGLFYAGTGCRRMGCGCECH